MTLAVLAALVGAAMFYLANFVEPTTREMSDRIPTSKLNPVPIIPPKPPPEPVAPEEPGEEGSGDEATDGEASAE